MVTERKQEIFWSKSADAHIDSTRYVVGEAVLREMCEALSAERNLGKVVEFGCGTGFFTRVIAPNAARVIATDLSDEMLAAAKAQLAEFQNVVVQKADAEGTTLPDEEFDTVFMANVIHVVEHPCAVLRQSRRVLKDGGLLLVTSLTSYGMNWWEKIKLGGRFVYKFGIPQHSRNYSPSELAALVESEGFQVTETRLLGEKTKALYLRGVKR
jgi:ubiquinone/menaquinone biosynthesis C-methylase UbiE